MSEHLFDLFRLELLADLAPEYLITFGEILAETVEYVIADETGTQSV